MLSPLSWVSGRHTACASGRRERPSTAQRL